MRKIHVIEKFWHVTFSRIWPIALLLGIQMCGDAGSHYKLPISWCYIYIAIIAASITFYTSNGPTKVGRIMVWHVSSLRPSVNIWLSTGVTTCRINFIFTDIMHLVRPIYDTGNGSCIYAHTDPITDFLILVIPVAIFQVAAFKFCTFGTLNWPINISPGFCDNRKILILAIGQHVF